MVDVLPRSTTETGLVHPERHASPIIVEPPYSVSHIVPYSAASLYGYKVSAYYSSPGSNGISQPGSPSPDRRSSVSSIESSYPPPRTQSTILGRRSRSLISPRGMITILGYTPSEGEANALITVNLEFRSGTEEDENSLGQGMSLTSMKLRLVFGRTAVKTIVSRLPPIFFQDGGEESKHGNTLQLQLHANAPSYSEVRFPDQFNVPLTIQAMDETTEIIESFTFGSFSYWTRTTIEPTATIDAYKFPTLPALPQNKRKREKGAIEGDSRLLSSELSPTLSSPKKALTAPPHVDKVFKLKLVRTTNAPAEALDDADTQPALLEWVVNESSQHPNSLDKKWSAHELAAGRRLIRFGREQVGHKLLVSCEVIAQEVYDEEDIVISCVYRQETRNCWFTSVDVIYLLERLVGGPFSVEEKNRIRRNLEGFKPTTVSKNKGGFEMFFQRIMDFPPPKPRNIEKDVKVFAWSLLCPALEKILSKYSVIHETVSDTSPSHETSSLPASVQAARVTKAGRNRSSSSVSQVINGESGLPKPSQAGPPQQPIHLAFESPPAMHPEPAISIPDPDPAPMSMDQFYYPHAPDLTFSSGDDWRRRDSIVSLATTSTHTDEGYPDHGTRENTATPGQLQANAFSNPFASHVNFGALSLGVHANGNGLDGLTDARSGNDGQSPAHVMRFDQNSADDIFAGRRTSLASDILFPFAGVSPSSNHDTIAAGYGVSVPEPHNVPHDLLYTQFSGGSIHHLPLEDVHA